MRVGEREKSESYIREDDYQQDRDREGGRQNRLPTLGARNREVDHTRRVKPRYDFLTEDSDSFGDLR